MSNNLAFIDAVNETLRRTGVIQGSTGAIVDFSVSAHQREIDAAVQLWNEGLHELYDFGLFIGELATATIVLSANTREYAVPSDFERMAGTPEQQLLRGATNDITLSPYPGGYIGMLNNQLTASDFAGRPTRYALSPNDGAIRVDFDPSGDGATESYNYSYEKEIVFTTTMSTTATGTTATELNTFPFSDTVTRLMVPIVSEFLSRLLKDKFDREAYRKALSSAVGHMNRRQDATGWGIRYVRT